MWPFSRKAEPKDQGPSPLELDAARIAVLRAWREVGQECRKCPHLAAIDRSAMTPEAKDEAKAWTCATHFLLESDADVFMEQILFDKSDDAFNARLVESFAAEYDDGSLDDWN